MNKNTMIIVGLGAAALLFLFRKQLFGGGDGDESGTETESEFVEDFDGAIVKKRTEDKRLRILNTWRDSLYKFKSENQSEHTTIHLNYDLENKWRFIVIEKDLIHFIDKSSTNIQDTEFVEFYTKFIELCTVVYSFFLL
jgi:hypothetical protein